MTVEYTRRAVADIFDIAEYYERNGAPGVGRLIAARIDEGHRADRRLAGKRQTGHARARLSRRPVGAIPYLIFYDIPQPSIIRILHIRHTSRRPWTGK